MSEHITSHETHESHHNPEHAEHIKDRQEKLSEHLEHAAKNAEHADVEAAKHKVEKLSETATKVSEKSHGDSSHSYGSPIATKQLKDTKFSHTMSSVQKRLPAPSRALSKVIHQDTIEALSELGEKTVARPIALLSGGFFAFISSSFFLYFAKKYGWNYNFGLFILSFIGGYIFGFIIEAVLRLMRGPAHDR